MKKIQVSTVRQTADVEVIFLNANFVAKAINATNAVDQVNSIAKNYGFENIADELTSAGNFLHELMIAFGVEEEPKEEDEKLPEPPAEVEVKI